jgi:hypothetical protein
MDVIRVCFNGSSSKPLPLCLSEQAALSRCKWMISKAVDILIDAGAPMPQSPLHATGTRASTEEKLGTDQPLVTAIGLLSGLYISPQNPVQALKPSTATAAVCCTIKELRLLLSLFTRASFTSTNGGSRGGSHSSHAVISAVELDATIMLSVHALENSVILKDSPTPSTTTKFGCWNDSVPVMLCAEEDGGLYFNAGYHEIHKHKTDQLALALKMDIAADRRAPTADRTDDGVNLTAGAKSLLSRSSESVMMAESKGAPAEHSSLMAYEDDVDSVLISELASLQWAVNAANELLRQAFTIIQESTLESGHDNAPVQSQQQLVFSTVGNMRRVLSVIRSKAAILKQNMLDFDKLNLTIRLLEAYQLQVTVLYSKLKSEVSRSQPLQTAGSSGTYVADGSVAAATSIPQAKSYVPDAVTENETFLANLTRAFASSNYVSYELQNTYTVGPSRASFDHVAAPAVDKSNSSVIVARNKNVNGLNVGIKELSGRYGERSGGGDSKPDDRVEGRYEQLRGNAGKSGSSLPSSEGPPASQNPLWIVLQNVFTHSERGSSSTDIL